MNTTKLQNKIRDYQIKVQKEIGFEADGHTYTRLSDGKLLTGVTTILQVRQKDFLKWWTVKLMYETLLPKLKEVQGISAKEWEAILMDGRKAHTRRTKDATDKGQAAHDWIENHIKGLMPDPPEDPQIKACTDAFLAWEAKHEVQWLASEMLVDSKAWDFAGTLDFLAIVDGKFTLGDFKTSNQISEDAFLQTAAYQVCLEEAGIVPEQRLILRIPKDGSGFEAAVVPTDLIFDQETFFHLRATHKWNINIANNHSDENGRLAVPSEKQETKQVAEPEKIAA